MQALRGIWPFAAGSIPFAFIGGSLSLPGSVYKQVLGLILLFAAYRWAKTKQTAGISAAFILVNSIAGIFGHLSSVKFLPEAIYPLAIAAVKYRKLFKYTNGSL